MEKKRGWDREAAGEVFLASDPLYHCFFGIGDEKGELLELLLARLIFTLLNSKHQNNLIYDFFLKRP
jgi:hypothetical protein